ncbi:site-specific DNA-methyltransferase [Paenibacillus polymyxa]|uniref:DNA-methyltransferase n=1 Tax=Paenibacillus polymyxa TaxID=1406 RepID=UPI00298CE8B8|nr:site-specific DNA-methyltransferase [Paenibacillus polymyxa]
MKLIEDNSVDLIVTDPPYNLGNFMRERDTNLKQLRSNFFGAAGWDDLEFSEWLDNMEVFFKHSNRILKKGGSMIMFMSLIKIESLIKHAAKYKLYYKTTGIWHKLNPMPRNMNLHFINSVEGWIYFTNETKTGTFNNKERAIHDFIETSLTPANEKKFGAHPTQKPESIIEHFVDILSNEGDTILDPFMGSGTTGVVAKRASRGFIGIELKDEYFDISLKRIGSVRQSSNFELEVIEGAVGD